MSRFARRTLPALLVVTLLGILPVAPAQARTLSHKNSTDVYGPINLGSLLHHLWTNLFSMMGRDGATADPNGHH